MNQLPPDHPLHDLDFIEADMDSADNVEIFNIDTGEVMSLVESVDLDNGVLVKLLPDENTHVKVKPTPDGKCYYLERQTLHGNWGVRLAS